jgi:hypothetical protein
MNRNRKIVAKSAVSVASISYIITIIVLSKQFEYLAYFHYFEKMKVDLCDLHTLCASVSLWFPPPVNFWVPEQIFMKLGMYIVSLELISVACVCMCIPPIVSREAVRKRHPLFVTRQRLCRHVPAVRNTNNNKRIFGSVCLITLLLLGINSVKMPAATRNCWRSRFLCGPYNIK